MKTFDPYKDWGVDIPRPKKFPVSFDEMLRYLMPQVETKSERRKRYFDCLQDTERTVLKDGKKVPDGKIPFTYAQSEFEKFKGQTFAEGFYCLEAQHFLRWWAERLAKRRSAIGSKGGRPKKSLEAEKNA